MHHNQTANVVVNRDTGSLGMVCVVPSDGCEETQIGIFGLLLNFKPAHIWPVLSAKKMKGSA